MNTDLHLRPATMSDADALLEWRNDAATRQSSLSTERVEVADHLKWLKASLHSEERRLVMAEVNHHLVGTIRADVSQDGWCLSWTVAPRSRGKGIALKMLNAFIKTFNAPLYAQVKATNIASKKVAERAGFHLVKKEDGVLYYHRDGAAEA